MNPFEDCAFDQPVALRAGCATLIRTAGQAADIVRSALRARFTIQGLNTDVGACRLGERSPRGTCGILLMGSQ